jgi:N6-L-threonylcarbamoyladenine synthase
MISIGIESTAHTFGIGIVEDRKVLANTRDVYSPAAGKGIHPIEAKEHHEKVKHEVLENALAEAGVSLSDIDIVSYSAGPGLPPCLKSGAELVKEISKGRPVFAVNHCIAHIEVGRFFTGARDPITLYVSGGNTQVIGFASGRYRVFGETQDISIGNARDVFGRELGLQYPAGRFLDEIAEKGSNYIELPYSVKGMDMSFTGIVTDAIRRIKKGENSEDVVYSFVETTYAMLVEVTERALAHTGKSEVLLTGGVAASRRFQEMISVMCAERGSRSFVCPVEYAGDNGAMIAITGMIMKSSGMEPIKEIDFFPRWRTDEVDVTWIR